MNIVFEGPDNSGKSTLARYIADTFNRPVIHSPGPPDTVAAINARVRDALRYQGVVFDRHPCVTNAIYDRMRQPRNIDEGLMLRFYDSRPLFVYCQGRSLDGHVVKEHDSDEHLQKVVLNHQRLCGFYDEWAKQHAHIWYRVGDSMEQILNLVKGAL